jgi:serine/threonine protein kinase
MALNIGTQLGTYEITALLGKGGMGEVYRARDLKLKREVAIKILPEEFSRDADRVNRFQREAEVLASLNHPNIAAIHDLQETSGTRYLILELVEGETLADRIARGHLPVEEALNITIQICEALEAAHERGIIHRDLKPANIKLTGDGRVKVLDFGLAKAMENPPQNATLLNSPTLVTGSMPGVIMGTAAYMSPEQAKGREVDRRTDIFGFGCVFYEMLTGRRAFDGEDVTDILGAVLRMEPDWTLLPTGVSPLVRRLLRLCLEKNPRNRRSTATDVRLDIEQALTEPAAAIRPSAPERNSRPAWMAFTIAVLVTAVLTVPALRYLRETPPPEIRLEVNTPPTADPFSFAISPDGQRLVFSASNEGKSQLWVRSIDSVAAQPLAGTAGARYPFWSPDSASVGFFADARLKRIDVVGGAPQILANAVAGFGGTWNRDGTILFAPTGIEPLFKVLATGGEPVAVTRLEAGQTRHCFPQFLPDGRHFIYFVYGGPGQGIYTGSLDGGSSKRLATAVDAAVVSPSGFLLFLRQTTLFAQTFDLKRQELSGNPFPVAEPVALSPSNAPGFSVAFGIVAYRSGSADVAEQLTWLDRSGKSLGVIGAPDAAGLADVELSPDGKRVAVSRTVNGNKGVWLVDTARGVPTPFTFDASLDTYPLWSPDGSRIVFASTKKGGLNLYWKLSSGAGADELLLESDQPKSPTDWSSDGRFLLFTSAGTQTGSDLWILPVSGDKKPPFSFLKTPFQESDGQFSPDGKWIAYQSNESGRYEIYVQPFPGPGGKFRISSNGGGQPRWNKNGKEIFYVSLDSKMIAAPVKLSSDGQSLEPGTPAALFPVRIVGGPVQAGYRQQFAVSADGQRFLVNLEAGEAATSPITLIYNWKPQGKMMF